MAARGKKLVTKSLPAFIARTQFGQILERVSGNRERFVVTKNGEAKAIILGVEDFLQAVVKIPPELAAIQAEAKKRGVDTLTLEEIEAEIQAVRQTKRRPRNALVGDRKIERAKQRGHVLPVHQAVKSATATKRITDEID